ncbi:retrovirus-related pol polyprotein from transposon TNT 1-94 [Tanacetum coccineum]
MDKCKTRLGYNAVPPPYIGNFMPQKSNLVYPSLDDFVDVNESVSESIVEKGLLIKTNEPKTTRKENGALIIEDWVSKRPVNTVQPRTAVNNVGPIKNIINNTYSTARRPFNKITATNNNNFTKKVNIVKGTRVNTARPKAVLSAVKGNKGNVVKASACWVWRPKHKILDHGNPQQDLKDKGVIDSGCSRHMTGNRSYLTDYEEIDGGFVAFGGNSKGGKITGKGKIKTGKLDFKDVYFVKELKFNLFSVSQMCDKKNNVLFTDTACVVLSPDFKLTDESHVLLKVPRKDNMYSVDLKNVVPQGGLTCLFAKATPDESNLWHRRLGHVNFKTINKLVKGNLVRGLPSKLLKQHRASCIENLINLRVKVIRCDNGTEFKNRVMNQFCEMNGIKREFGVSRTPQQNRVAERKNMTLIKAARTMLADSKLPTTFWAKAVNNDCRKHALNFMRPFGCPVTIFNTIDHLGKFDGKADEGFFVGYSTNSKAFRVFNNRTRIVEENPHVQFRNQSNGSTCTKACDNAGKARMETIPGIDYILLPLSIQDPPFSSSSKDSPDVGFKPLGRRKRRMLKIQGIKVEIQLKGKIVSHGNNTNNVNVVNSTVNAAGSEVNVPKKVIQALKDPSLIEAMQEELLQFKLQQVWTLVDLPNGKRTIGTKWVYRNKKDERSIVIKNKARLVAQGYTQKEGIDYDEVFAPFARIEAIRLFLAYVSFIHFVVYQMDVKSAFLYETIEEKVYVCQPPGFEDPNFPDRVYKVEKALYGAWHETLSTYLLDNGF